MSNLNIKVLDSSGAGKEDVKLNEAIFNTRVSVPAMHQTVVAHLAGRRQGTANCKTRSEVRGGGAKPWRQKGTGRARAGTLRSPIFRGGGVVFAHKTRQYDKKVNRKYKRLALKSALTDKVNNNQLIIIDDVNFSQVLKKENEKYVKMTKSAKAMLTSWNVDSSAVVVFDNIQYGKDVEKFENFNLAQLAFGNLKKVNVMQAKYINVYEILKHDYLVLTKSALLNIEEVLNEN